jgi:hypothetical protein
VEKSADEGLTADQLLDLGSMPDLTGSTGEEAIALVQAHGFHTWPRDTFTNHVEPGFVVFTEPRAGTAANFEPIVIWIAVPVPPPDPPPDLTPPMPIQGRPSSRTSSGPPMNPAVGHGLTLSR